MKLLLALVLAAAATAYPAEIPQGTRALLRLEHAINTRTAEAGDHVYLRTATPIRVDGGPFIPPGAPVIGRVTRVQHGGHFHGRAKLEIGLETLLLPSGSSVNLSPIVAVAGKSGVSRRWDRDPDGRARLAVGAGVLAGFVLGGVAGRLSHDEDIAAGVGLGAGVAAGVATAILTRNRDAELREGASFDIVFDRPIKLD